MKIVVSLHNASESDLVRTYRQVCKALDVEVPREVADDEILGARSIQALKQGRTERVPNSGFGFEAHDLSVQAVIE